ncbi:hypothetical protein RvY_14155 [Ramazzottius varieornatus]|uniref:Uncharacterized protein n=1 Tax=Ramazzottius varieornatus TaxID=947166 RepID=A0A1D1VQD1_RAMVA|nr:hypothetical protein RvY_14155 [Ramazzottius varieornatus]
MDLCASSTTISLTPGTSTSRRPDFEAGTVSILQTVISQALQPSNNDNLRTAQREGGDSSFDTLVESFLKYASQNGIPEGFNWSEVRAVVVTVPNVDNYTFGGYHQRISGYLDRFGEWVS